MAELYSSSSLVTVKQGYDLSVKKDIHFNLKTLWQPQVNVLKLGYATVCHNAKTYIFFLFFGLRQSCLR